MTLRKKRKFFSLLHISTWIGIKKEINTFYICRYCCCCVICHMKSYTFSKIPTVKITLDINIFNAMTLLLMAFDWTWLQVLCWYTEKFIAYRFLLFLFSLFSNQDLLHAIINNTVVCTYDVEKFRISDCKKIQKIVAIFWSFLEIVFVNGFKKFKYKSGQNSLVDKISRKELEIFIWTWMNLNIFS